MFCPVIFSAPKLPKCKSAFVLKLTIFEIQSLIVSVPTAPPQNTEEPYVNIRKPVDQSSVKFQNEEFALDFGAKTKSNILKCVFYANFFFDLVPKIKQLIRPPPSTTKPMDHMDGLHRTARLSSRRRDYVADRFVFGIKLF